MVQAAGAMAQVDGGVALGLAWVADLDSAQERTARGPGDRRDGRPDEPQLRAAAACADAPLCEAGTVDTHARPRRVRGGLDCQRVQVAADAMAGQGANL